MALRSMSGVRMLSAMAVAGLLAVPGGAFGAEAAPAAALAKMPVKEVTVFKDGHAFVLHAGKMPTDAAGNVIMDHLPAPVIGTFWPYSADKTAKLHSVTAGRRRVSVERTSLSLPEMIEANIGAEVIVTERPAAERAAAVSYPATIVGFPKRSGEELGATSPSDSPEMLPVKGSTVLLKTIDGTKAVALERIQDVTFKNKFKEKAAEEEFRNLLTLHLDWGGAQPEKTADVGMMYLQKGVRWIPSYKIEINGAGKAVVKLQATLINELTDLSDVTAHLVVGVPTFLFKDTTDPISLNQVIAQLSQHFEADALTGQQFSNAIMTQTVSPRMRAVRAPAGPAAADLGPDIGGADKSEDLFLFTVKHVSLKKGERMVLPVAECAADYRDVYTLDIPFAPPPEVRGQIRDERAAELERQFHSPKAVHDLRLTNKGPHPFTTAPALIVKDNRVLAQGMMRYTPVGAEVDMTVTTAVDIQVKKADKETQRTPRAAELEGHQFTRVDLSGTITLVNHGKAPAEVEVVRHVLGKVGIADNDGAAEMVNVFEDGSAAAAYPYWWGWYNWPYGFHHFNGIGRITWKVKLEPGKSADLHYTWLYYRP